jgi:Holliday junction resolvasome RuvABC endonuclease subunit
MAVINIMGIDPSLSATGWCIASVDTESRKILRILEIGLCETEKGKGKQVRKSSDDLARARKINQTLRERITAHGVKVGASEVPSGAQSASASRAFGIVVGLLAGLPIPLIEVSPTEVKVASCNSKIADKEDMVRFAIDLPGAIEAFLASETTLTTPRANEWGIQIGVAGKIPAKHVGKKAEHPADACGAVTAAIGSEQFRQLCAMLNSLI